MRRTAAVPALPLAVALSASLLGGCASLGDGDLAEFTDDVAEFFGADIPLRHVRRLEALHDPGTFAHVPDLPPTYESCHAEVRALADSEYEDWREASGSVFLLARVAVEDEAALHRGEAVRGLARVGGFFRENEAATDGTAIAGPEVAAALDRLRRIHAGARESGHDGAECAALLRRLAEFRVPVPEDPGPAGLKQELRVLRGTLLGVLVESGPDGEAADAALVGIGVQVARTAVAAALLQDADPRVRCEAAAAAGSLGGPHAGGLLRAAYGREGDVAARRRIVCAAGVVVASSRGASREGAAQVLLAALEDDDRTARLRARDALREAAGRDLGEAREPWLEWWARAGAGP
jgi:hypothetical protein